jgi:hypothetical protein
MKTNEQIIERWSKTGMLDGLPEDRKEMVATSFEFLLNYLVENDISNNGDIESLSFPIIRRIGAVVDITTDDIENIVQEIKEQYYEYNTFDEELYENDKELAFCTEFSEKKINEMKK